MHLHRLPGIARHWDYYIYRNIHRNPVPGVSTSARALTGCSTLLPPSALLQLHVPYVCVTAHATRGQALVYTPGTELVSCILAYLPIHHPTGFCTISVNSECTTCAAASTVVSPLLS